MTDKRTMFYGASPLIFERAKELRQNMTYHEKLLLEELRANKIYGFRFKAQHPISTFIVDFYCHKLKLVIEVDGDTHNTIDSQEYDSGRNLVLREFGIETIRFTNLEIEENYASVIMRIKEQCLEITKNLNLELPATLRNEGHSNWKQSITPASKGGTVPSPKQKPPQGGWGFKPKQA